MICNLYHPSSFHMRYEKSGCRGCDVFGVFSMLDADNDETGECFIAYIRKDDDMLPPVVDLDFAESFIWDFDSFEYRPAFDAVTVSDDGRLMLSEYDNVFVLTDEQFELLCEPVYLYTASGGYWKDEREVASVFRKDETLDMLPRQTLDMRKFNGAIGKKLPALLEKTQAFYGNRYPEFPNAKFYEDKNRMVVFMTREQASMLPVSVLSGRSPMYRDVRTGTNWGIDNIYGICMIDASDEFYRIKLVAPSALVKYNSLPSKKNYIVDSL